jgi:hypothetical protein
MIGVKKRWEPILVFELVSALLLNWTATPIASPHATPYCEPICEPTVIGEGLKPLTMR